MKTPHLCSDGVLAQEAFPRWKLWIQSPLATTPPTSRSFTREGQISKVGTWTEDPGGKEGETHGVCRCPVVRPVSQHANGLGPRLAALPILAGTRHVVCPAS